MTIHQKDMACLTAFVMIVVLCWLILFAAYMAIARDLDGHYAAANPKLHEWFQLLKPEGSSVPCCSDADGALVQDADWDTVKGPDGKSHYRVRVNKAWVDVPDSSVITTPNLDGRTLVWGYPIQGWGANAGGYFIRCFMPGVMG